MKENDISYIIRGIVFKIEKELGPGLFESVYEEIMEYELKKAGLKVERQKPVQVVWDDQIMAQGFRADLVVEDLVLIENKSVESLAKIHYKQVQTYLGLTGLKLGLLINFNNTPMTIRRIANGL